MSYTLNKLDSTLQMTLDDSIGVYNLMQISLLVPTALISICMHWIRQWLKGELHGLGAFVRILQGELLSSTQFYSMYIFRQIWTRRFHLKSYNPSQIIIRHSECKYHNGTCDGLGRTFEYQRGVLWNEFLCCLKLSCRIGEHRRRPMMIKLL